MSERDQMHIGILRLYVKDLSFESPKAPAIFEKNWRPEIGVEIGVRTNKIQDHVYEVSLELTVKATFDKEVGFIVEVEQAGLFEVKAPDKEQLDRVLRIFCPSTLFPYARQAIDQSLLQGGFPPLMLAPINFETLAEQAQ